MKTIKPTVSLLLLLAAARTEAATITVTSTSDNGAGSLRNAIASGGSGATINFTNTLSGQTILLTGGQIILSNNVTIDGSALTNRIQISGNASARIFQIGSGVTVVLNSLTLTNGNGAGTVATGTGGAIYNLGALTLTNCLLAGNKSVQLGGAIDSTSPGSSVNALACNFIGNNSGGNNGGGAIYGDNFTLINVADCNFLTNRSPTTAGAIHINNSGTGVVARCTFSGNSANDAGAVRNSSGSLTLTASTFTGNLATNNGGALLNVSATALTNCTFAGNSANSGGAIDTFSTININQCTFTANSANDGGAMFSSSGTSIVNQCTFALNRSTGINPGNDGGGAIDFLGVLVLTNSILAGNTAATGQGPDLWTEGSGLTAVDCLIGDNTSSAITNGVNGNLAGTSASPLSAQLAALGSYGGSTQTMPPLAGSPAIDAGSDSVTNLLATDQRGQPRRSNGRVDIGAVELRTPFLVVTTNSDDSATGSLRNIIAGADVGSTITFTNTLSGRAILLTNGQVILSNSLTISGSGLTNGIQINGTGNGRIFQISSGTTVGLNSLTLTNGNGAGTVANGTGGAIYNLGALTLTNCLLAGNRSAQLAGAINSTGAGSSVNALGCNFIGNNSGGNNGGGAIYGDNFTLINVADCNFLTNHSPTTAGAIHIINNATGVVLRCTFAGNSSSDAGAVRNNSGTVTLGASTFAGNIATNIGGAVYNLAATVVTNCTFAGNWALDGGAIRNNNGGTLSLGTSTFTNNIATDIGGGIYSLGATVISNCVFAGNSATNTGGGIYNIGTATITTCTFAGNIATNLGGGIYTSNAATFAGCTFTGNTALLYGGGFYNDKVAALTNCTFVSNLSHYGGGAFNGGSINLNQSTFTANSANDGGAFLNNSGTGIVNQCTFTLNHSTGLNAGQDGGGAIDAGSVFSMTNCILAGNTAATGQGPDLWNEATSITVVNCLIGDNTSSSVASGVNGNLAGTSAFPLSAQLGALGSYGGSTQTMPPLAGSPAIDAGSDSVTNFLATDQRGFPRRSGSHVDIGAVELSTPFLVVTTNSDNAASGTLRNIIAGADVGSTITFANTLSGQRISLTGGQIVLNNNVTISGSGLANGIQINGNGSGRIFQINSGATVVLNSLTLTNGNGAGAVDTGTGGAIYNLGALTLTNCLLTGNNSLQFAGAINSLGAGSSVNALGCNFIGNNSGGLNGGGAIYGDDFAFINVSDCNFLTNHSPTTAGAIHIINGATGVVTRCTFAGNSANDAGAVRNSSGVLTLRASTFTGNVATNDGGAIYNASSTGLTNCAFAGNLALFGGAIGNDGSLNLNQSTFTGNSANDAGGLINNSGTSIVNQCTFTLNHSTGTNLVTDGGGAIDAAGVLAMTNCILAGNTATTGSGPDLWSEGTSLTAVNCLIGDNTSSTIANGVNGNLAGTSASPLSARLSALGSYGGKTQTMPPLAGSPAIDAGSDSVTNFLTTDQRGFPRRSSSHVDIGAVELSTPFLVVTTNSDDSVSGTLRNVVAGADVGSTITFANTLSGQRILLTGGQIVLNNNVTINGSGLAGGIQINGNGGGRIFQINSGVTVMLNSLTLTNGNGAGAVDTGSGGAIYNLGALTLTNCLVAGNNSLQLAGAINSTGAGSSVTALGCNFIRNNSGGNNGGGAIYGDDFTFINVSDCNFLTNHSPTTAGAIHIINNATGVVLRCTFAGNSAIDAGAVRNNSGTLSIGASTFTGNIATNFGGALYNLAATVATNCTFAGNWAFDGGAIHNDSGGTLALGISTFTNNIATDIGGAVCSLDATAITNCAFAGNSATNTGGGIYNIGTAAITTCTFAGNIATNLGGGIYTSNAATLAGCIFTGNTALLYGGGFYNDKVAALTNCTFVSNLSHYGGGAFNGGSINLNQSTFTANSATDGGAFLNNSGTGIVNQCTFTLNHSTGLNAVQDGGGAIDAGSVFSMTNCILAGNTAAIGRGPDLWNEASSFTVVNCLIGDNTSSTVTNGVKGNLAGTSASPLSAQLGALGNYGGLTQTMPPLAGSPAIDAGTDAVLSFLATDQRGQSRRSGDHVDIGAAEAQLITSGIAARITGAEWTGSEGNSPVRLSFTNLSGASFRLFATTNLSVPLSNWTLLGFATESPASSGQFQFIDSLATNQTQRFFRVRSP